MIAWVKAHPYLSGGLILGLIVFYFIYRSISSSNAAAASATYNPATDPSLLAAQLQAGTQTQLATTAATVAQNQTNAELAAVQTSADALAAAKVQTGAQVSLADIQTQGMVDLATIQTNGQVTIAGQAAQTQQDQIAAAEAEQASINATQLGLANVAAGVSIAGINYQTDVVNRQADIAYTTLVQGGETTRAGISAAKTLGTQQIQQGTTLGLSAISAQKTIDLSQINVGGADYQALLASINAGTYNKGGQGGAYQISALQALTGQPVGGAAQNTASVAAASSASMWSKIVASLAGTATAAVGA